MDMAHFCSQSATDCKAPWDLLMYAAAANSQCIIAQHIMVDSTNQQPPEGSCECVPKSVSPWMRQDLVSELENERTNRVIAQQTANQERLQARASAVESASLRRQLNELNQQMEQERRTAAVAKLQTQQAQTSRVSAGHSAASASPALNCPEYQLAFSALHAGQLPC